MDTAQMHDASADNRIAFLRFATGFVKSVKFSVRLINTAKLKESFTKATKNSQMRGKTQDAQARFADSSSFSKIVALSNKCDKLKQGQ